MSPRLEFAVDVAWRAGRFTLGLFGTGTPIQLKPDQTPVTEADRGAERLIREAIQSRFPGEAVYGEEEGPTGEGNSRWVIDPIDGTKSFVCGVPLYATLLSFEEGGVPILGVACFPALDEILYAERGRGAFWNGRPARVSERASLDGAVLSVGSHKGLVRTGRLEGFLRLAERAMATRTWCDGFGHALVATGRIEAMVDPIVERYDVSAVQVIVEEAGGRFTDFAGRTNPSHEALASNGRV
ncbi:MAG: inositol monophosphatase family protein, partial [Fimbriimonadales bacterium]